MVASIINSHLNRELANSQLELSLGLNRAGQTTITRHYQTHPLRISQPFYLDGLNSSRAYLYLRNNSPGLLSGDRYKLDICLQPKTKLHLTEQSAAKAHPMLGGKALVNYNWQLEHNTQLEFLPEPLILYSNSALAQNTTISMSPSASLFWCDIVLPGRLARGELYQFDYYRSCLEIFSTEGELWLRERTRLEGKNNQFAASKFFSTLPIMGTAIVIQPQIELEILKAKLADLGSKRPDLMIATSTLPQEKGLLIKGMTDKSKTLKSYFASVLAQIRLLQQDSAFPNIPK